MREDIKQDLATIKELIEKLFSVSRLFNQFNSNDSQSIVFDHLLPISQVKDYPDFVFPKRSSIYGQNTYILQDSKEIIINHQSFKYKLNERKLNGLTFYLFNDKELSSMKNLIDTLSDSIDLLNNYQEVQTQPNKENIEKFLNYHKNNPFNLIMVACSLNNEQAINDIVELYGLENTMSLFENDIEIHLNERRREIEKRPNSFDENRHYTLSQMASIVRYFHSCEKKLSWVRTKLFAEELADNLKERVESSKKMKI